jgi:uncharacterized protein (TIGR02118 family)
VIVATVRYRQGINEAYYLNHHVPLSEKLMVPLGVSRAEIIRFTPAPDGTLPEYRLMTMLFFPSLEVFQSVMQNPVMAELMADVKNFYDGEPELAVAELIANTVYANG